MITLSDVLSTLDQHTLVRISLGYKDEYLDEGEVYEIISDLDDDLLSRKVRYMEIQTLYSTSETDRCGSRSCITNKVESWLYILLEPVWVGVSS